MRGLHRSVSDGIDDAAALNLSETKSPVAGRGFFVFIHGDYRVKNPGADADGPTLPGGRGAALFGGAARGRC